MSCGFVPRYITTQDTLLMDRWRPTQGTERPRGCEPVLMTYLICRRPAAGYSCSGTFFSFISHILLSTSSKDSP